MVYLNSCAQPHRVDITSPGDEKLNCKELKEGFFETREFRKEAESMRDPGTGGNTARMVLFWPALVKTLNNADEAIRAADNRAFHLVKIMRNKNCKEADKLASEITKKNLQVYYSLEIQKLYKQYKKGILTEEEFKLAKKKVLEK